MARKDALLRLHQNLIAKRNSLRRKLVDELDLAEGEHTNGDIADAAADGSQTEIDSQLAALESRELSQVDHAIELIRQGRYGSCEQCHEKIPVARLKALPFCLLCIDCQRRQEVHGPRSGGFDADWESAYEYEGKTSERELTLNDIELEL